MHQRVLNWILHIWWVTFIQSVEDLKNTLVVTDWSEMIINQPQQVIPNVAIF